MRRIMVTGATGGIGRELVALLAAGGDEVLAVGRSAGSLAELPATPVVADLTDPAAVDGALRDLGLVGGSPGGGRTAAGTAGGLDGLVHSAGIVALAPIANTSYRSWLEQLTVNLAAPAELTRLLLPALRERGGSVVFVNSGAGLHANPHWGAYAASKHGLRALADVLRAEEPALRVTTVYPGRTATAMQQAVRAAEGGTYQAERYLRPETVAAAILAALDTPADAQLTELNLRPNG